MFKKRERKDEMDLAAERIIEKVIHKTEAENIDIEKQTQKEGPTEVPNWEKHESEEINKEKTIIPPSDKIMKLLKPINKDLEKIEDKLVKINPKIDSVSQLLPTLNPLKELLKRNIVENKIELEKKTTFLQELKKQEEDLDQDLQKKQEIKEGLEKKIDQMEEALAELRNKIPVLTDEKERIEADLTQREENLRLVEEHIRRIISVQKASSTPIIEAS